MKNITIVFNGGLGNQLFQFIYLLYHKKILFNSVFLNKSMYKKYKIHEGFLVNKVFKIDSFDENKKDFSFVYSLLKRCPKWSIRFFNSFVATDLTINRLITPKYYLGYWQNVKYYEAVKYLLPQYLLDLSKYCNDDKLKKAISADLNSVSLHIRRGDYCNNALYVDLTKTDYYKLSIEYLSSLLVSPTFYVFSDDIEWAKNYLSNYKNMFFVEYDNQSALGDLYLMNLCRNSIVANSSFSWWGAVINPKNNVVYPSKYEQDKDNLLYLHDWKKIEVL